MEDMAHATPLEPGSLAPEFKLEATDGRVHSRGEYRNKKAMVLFFFEDSKEAATLLNDLAARHAEFEELGVQVLGIGHDYPDELQDLVNDLKLPFPVLFDGKDSAWYAYSKQSHPGYGVFVLDKYGGVDTQKLAQTSAGLPDGESILDWARGAQYRCNI
jgi:peroxiredoxin